MNTIEVGSVVKLADELFYAIDSTRMASIEYGIVNSKGTHISEVNHGGTIIEFAPLAYDPKLFKIVLRFYGKVSAHTISLLDNFIKGAYIVSSNLKIIKKNNQELALMYWICVI
jgi:hypothetical protein